MLNRFATQTAPSRLNQSSDRTDKLLVFKMGKLHLALPVASVKKVLRYAPLIGSGTTATGIVHLDNREITAIDLHKRLFKTASSETFEQSFLILAKNSINELFGLVVGETPSLIDVPRSQIRVLPESYRRSDTLEVASHVTVIESLGQLTVFILDADSLVPPIGLGEFVL